MKRRWLAVVLVVLAGCASNDGQSDEAAATTTSTTVAPTTTTLATTTTLSGVSAFLAEVEASGFADKYEVPTNAPEWRQAMIGVGNRTCENLPVIGYGGAIEGLLQIKELDPTPEQASRFVRAAVENLCPQHRDLLP